MKNALCLVICVLQFLCSAGIKAADDVSIWRNSAAGFDDTRVTYLEENGPSKLEVSCMRHEDGAPQTVEEVRYRSRALVTTMRHGFMRSYERREEATSDITAAAPKWDVCGHHVQTRTPVVFKYLDKLRHTAAVWSAFRWDPRTVLDAVTPPAAEDGTFTPVEGRKYTWEFRSKDGKRVVRYWLDPDNGMMPMRIETYQVAEPLFLNGIVEIRQYEKHGDTLFPVEATFYRNMGGKPGTWDSKDVHRLMKVETAVRFTPTDFNAEFSPDVRVRDHRSG